MHDMRPATSDAGLLANRNFLRLWAIGGLANTARWFELLAAALFAFAATDSAGAVAAVTAARTLPMLLFGAFAGAIADSVDRKQLMRLGLTIAATSSTLVAILASRGQLQLWHLVLLSFLAGLVWAGELAVRRRMAAESVEPARIGQAVALDSVTNSATRMLGPLAGGFAVEQVGVAGAFLVTASCQWLALLLAAQVHHAQRATRLRLANSLAEISEGIGLARGNRAILLVLAGTFTVNGLGFAYTGLVAPLGKLEFGLSPTLIGVLAASEPAGAAFAGLILAFGIRPLGDSRLFVGGSLLFFGALCAAALAPSFGLAALAFVAAGLGAAGFANMQTTIVMTQAPPAMRSRILGLTTVGIGMGPIGILVAGLVAEFVGPAGALLAMAACGLTLIALIGATLSRPRATEP